MPRLDLNRDAFVARIGRRERRARLLARILRASGLSTKSFQAEAYDRTFRSDAEAVSYSYVLYNDHLPDLEQPIWLNEKIRWQFLHHPNPLMTIAADKLAVREYLRYKGATIHPPELLASGTDPLAIASMDLPPRFVLKTNHGSGQNYKRDGSDSPAPLALARRLAEWHHFDQWRRTGELHYRGMPKGWLMEELLPVNERSLEFGITCFNGVPQWIRVITERRGKGYDNIRQVMMSTDWKPLMVNYRGLPNQTVLPPRPAFLDWILDEARQLSEDFMQVRVDFMQFGDRLAFSELTFASSAGRIPFEPLERNAELGALLDLSRAPEYLARGERIAADLGWSSAGTNSASAERPNPDRLRSLDLRFSPR